jgi:hypothetical protein
MSPNNVVATCLPAMWAHQASGINAAKPTKIIRAIKEKRMSARSPEHMDVNVNSKQAMTVPVILQAIGMLAAVSAVYATMVANDREHTAKIDQLRVDVARIERDTKDIKVEILTEIRELRTELREKTKGGK